MKKLLLLLLITFNIGYSQCNDCPTLNINNLSEEYIELFSNNPICLPDQVDWANPLLQNVEGGLLMTLIEDPENQEYYLILEPEYGYFNITEEFWINVNNNNICYYSYLSLPEYSYYTEEYFDIYTIDGKYLEYNSYNNIFILQKGIYIIKNNKKTLKIAINY